MAIGRTLSAFGAGPAAERGAAPSRPARWRPAAAALAVVLAVLALSGAVVGTAVAHHRPIFILDEWTYVDYLYKVDHGHLWMPRGDVVGQDAVRAVACRGTQPNFYPTHPPCGLAHYDTRHYLNDGISTAAIHPPTYFLLTDLGARAVMAVGGTHDLVTAGRLVGAAWMAAGLLMLILLAREFGAGRLATGIAVLAVAVTGKFVEEWQYLTPDAANLLVGGVVMLSVVRWLRGRWPWWSLPLAGAFAIALKSPNLLVVGAGMVAILFAVTARPLRQRLAGAAGLGAGAAAVAALIGGVQAAIARTGFVSPQDRTEHADRLHGQWFLDNLDTFVRPFGRPGHAYALAHLLGFLVLGLVVASVFTLASADLRQPVGVGVLSGVVLGPAVLIVLVFGAQHEYAPIEERYGYSLMPAVFALAASHWRGRLRLAAVGALVAVYAVFAVHAFA